MLKITPFIPSELFKSRKLRISEFDTFFVKKIDLLGIINSMPNMTGKKNLVGVIYFKGNSVDYMPKTRPFSVVFSIGENQYEVELERWMLDIWTSLLPFKENFDRQPKYKKSNKIPVSEKMRQTEMIHNKIADIFLKKRKNNIKAIKKVDRLLFEIENPDAYLHGLGKKKMLD